MSSKCATLLFLCLFCACRNAQRTPSLAIADTIGEAAERLRHSADADATVYQALDVRGQSIVAIVPPGGTVRGAAPVGAPTAFVDVLQKLPDELRRRMYIAVVHENGSSIGVEIERHAVRVASPFVVAVPAGASVAVELKKTEGSVVEIVGLHPVER